MSSNANSGLSGILPRVKQLGVTLISIVAFAVVWVVILVPPLLRNLDAGNTMLAYYGMAWIAAPAVLVLHPITKWLGRGRKVMWAVFGLVALGLILGYVVVVIL